MQTCESTNPSSCQIYQFCQDAQCRNCTEDGRENILDNSAIEVEIFCIILLGLIYIGPICYSFRSLKASCNKKTKDYDETYHNSKIVPNSAEDNEKSVKTNTVQPPEKTTRRFSVSKERKKKMNAQSFASGYLNFRLIIVDENTGNIIEVYKPYASNLDKDVLNYINSYYKIMIKNATRSLLF